jgi:spermidine synthase
MRPGPITLSEHDGVRFLHFGSRWVQGAMRIARPFSLELEYQKQMMAPALFIPEPSRVVQLGLGAGALTKFCYRHLPSAEILAVELSDQVIRTARASFRLPPDDQRLRVIHCDALRFLSESRLPLRADWLQVDLYDRNARGPVYDDPGFYLACRRALARPGVACFNLFGSSFEASLNAIRAAFGKRVLAFPEVEEGNRIVLGFAGPRFEASPQALVARAEELRRRRLPAADWVSQLRAANRLADGSCV